VRAGQAAVARPWYLAQFATSVLSQLPDIDARLKRAPAARVVEVGCGVGWAAIAIALAYPLVQIDSYDPDHHSIVAAQANAVAAGVDARIRYNVEDIVAWPPDEPYDLTICCHHLRLLPRPVELLRSLRKVTRPEGVVLIGEPPAGESFTGRANPDERIAFGISLFHDLPVGMYERPSSGTGGLLRPDLLRQYAMAAGFADIIQLPVEEGGQFFRLELPAMTGAEVQASQYMIDFDWLEVP
jgi:SAM-dependent methyltransferase